MGDEVAVKAILPPKNPDEAWRDRSLREVHALTVLADLRTAVEIGMILAAGLTPAWQQILTFQQVSLGEVNRVQFS